MPNPNNPDEWECKACHDTGYRPFSNTLCDCVNPYKKRFETEPMLTQCGATESGGVQCEVLLSKPDEEHHHSISNSTIERHLRGSGW